MDHTEFQLLVAQARHEAANPAFKVSEAPLMRLNLGEGKVARKEIKQGLT